MASSSSRLGIALLSVMVGFGAWGENTSTTTPLKGLRSSPYLLMDNTDYQEHPLGSPMLSAGEGFNFDSHLYGLYGGLDPDIDDFYLYLFPDGRFVVKDDCHCATPSFVLASGSWQRHAGVLSFRVERKAKTACAADSLREMGVKYGDLSKVDVFVTTRAGRLNKLLLVPEQVLMQAAMDRLFVRQEGFSDWKQEQAKLMRQFGSAPKGRDCGTSMPNEDAAKTKP